MPLWHDPATLKFCLTTGPATQKSRTLTRTKRKRNSFSLYIDFLRCLVTVMIKLSKTEKEHQRMRTDPGRFLLRVIAGNSERGAVLL